MSSWNKTTKYTTTNWPDYNTALKQRGSLSIGFDPNMTWQPGPSGKRGRTPRFSDAAIQACLTLKMLFNLPLRQTTGFVESLLKLLQLDWAVPDYSTLSRRAKTLSVQLSYRSSSEPLTLLVDSTGVKIKGEGEWQARKHGVSCRRQWRKLHIGIDADTLEVRAVEVTSSQIGDSPMLPDLLDQLPDSEPLERVMADGAYDTRQCYDAIVKRGAAAVIPPRKNAAIWPDKTQAARARNDTVEACRRFGRRCWKQLSDYHQRSLVESKMHCVKRLGQSVIAREAARQVAELQARIGVLNVFTALGRPVTVAVD